jgi:hypothetical protein
MLRRGPREVDLELVAGDRDRSADLELAAAGRLERVDGLEASVGQTRDRSAYSALGVGVELVHRRFHLLRPAAGAQLVDPLRSQPVGRQLRAEVAAPLVGIAHPAHELIERLLVQPGRRNDDALLVEPVGDGRQAPGLDPAHVGVMGSRDRVAQGRAGDERDVGQVRAAGEGVVEDEDVVRARIVLADGGHGVGHRAEVHRDVLRLGDHAPTLVEERGRAVAALLDVGREGGANQHRPHLVGHRPQGRADQLQLNFHFRLALVTHP